MSAAHAPVMKTTGGRGTGSVAAARRQRLMKDFLVKKPPPQPPQTTPRRGNPNAGSSDAQSLPPPCKINFGDEIFPVLSSRTPSDNLDENKENNNRLSLRNGGSSRFFNGSLGSPSPVDSSRRQAPQQQLNEMLPPPSVDSRDSVLSQCSQFSQYSQEDFLTPQDQPVQPAINPNTPSPIRKKSRHTAVSNRLYVIGDEHEGDGELNRLVEDMDVLDFGANSEAANHAQVHEWQPRTRLRQHGIAGVNAAPRKSNVHGSPGTDSSPESVMGDDSVFTSANLPEVSVNPFCMEKVPEKRKRRDRRRHQVDDFETSVNPNVSRYLFDFSEIEIIGSGSFSQVYKVRRRLDGWIYAIKKARKKFRGSADRQRALMEVFALSALGDCPHVIRYYNSWIEDDQLYIQTEYCALGTLEQQLQKLREACAQEVFDGHLPENELKLVLCHMAKALSSVHNLGLAHLDVKPSNIFLTAEGKYKLGDFGQVARVDCNDDITEGDNRYLSRELLEGDRTNLQAADMFALGATIYEMALGNGSLPGQGEEWQRIRNGHLAPFRCYTPQFQLLLASLLHPDPSQRPAASRLLTHELLAGMA